MIAPSTLARMTDILDLTFAYYWQRPDRIGANAPQGPRHRVPHQPLTPEPGYHVKNGSRCAVGWYLHDGYLDAIDGIDALLEDYSTEDLFGTYHDIPDKFWECLQQWHDEFVLSGDHAKLLDGSNALANALPTINTIRDTCFRHLLELWVVDCKPLRYPFEPQRHAEYERRACEDRHVANYIAPGFRSETE